MSEESKEIEYSASAWGETHHDFLKKRQMEYRFAGSNVVFTFDLQPGNFTLKPRWQTHRYFRVSLVLLLLPPFVLGTV